MITQLQKGKNYFYQISLAMLVAMISIVGCKKNEPSPTPEIRDFKAPSGWVGNIVTLTGTNFGGNVASNIVKFGDKIAVINSATVTVVNTVTITELKVVVPAGATTGKISVTVNGVTGTSTTDFVVNTGTVYIAGSRFGDAGYWKNENFIKSNAFISSLAVVGNDVYYSYVKGDFILGTKAGYSKNGVDINIGNGVNWSWANKITVVNNDVYVAGYEQNTSLKNVAKYWKNGIATSLTDGTKDAGITAIQVVGNDVYVAGVDDARAKYWKNGIVVNLSSVGSFASSIFVLGNDVYVGGQEYNANNVLIPKYWKNGIAITLGDGVQYGDVSAIKVVGNDVYATGSETNSNRFSVAKYWKNGVAVNLTDGTKKASATAMQVVGNDVHIIGIEDSNKAKYWKNGVLVDFEEAFALSSEARAIVVIP